MKFNIKYFLIGFIISVILGFIIGNNDFSNSSNTSSENIETVVVELGDIKKSIEVVGEAELIDEQKLTFNKVGTITEVNFKAGDEVKKGETIAMLDDSDAYREIENAKLSLDSAKINLNQLYEKADKSKIMQAKNSITTSTDNLEIAKKELENLEESQKTSLEKQISDLEISKKELDNLKEVLDLDKQELETLKKEKNDSLDDIYISKNSIIMDIENDFKVYLANVEEIIQESDYIMGVSDENRSKNDSFEDYLGAKDSIIKNKAKESLRNSIGLYESLKEELDLYDYSGNKENIESILNSYLDIYNKLYETTDYIYKTAENSITSIGSLTDSDISSIKNNMNSYRSITLSKISSIKSSIDDLNTLTDTDLIFESNSNTIFSKEESIKNSELDIEKKEITLKNDIENYKQTIEDYKLNIQEKEDNIKKQELALEVANQDLAELLEGPTEDNVTKSKNSIRQAELKLASAYEDLEDYMLQAPFDGLITSIDYMPGDNLKDDNDKYVYIENPNLLEVSVMLDQIDIVNVVIGNEAVITFDSYITSPVKAKISNIDTTPVKNSGVVSYEVKFIIDDPEFDKKILSGMTADVEIIIMSKENILLLKTSAIKTIGNKKMVIVFKNGKQEKVEIETGISSGGISEIISGINVGDEILLEGFSIQTTEKESTIFGTPGSGRKKPE